MTDSEVEVPSGTMSALQEQLHCKPPRIPHEREISRSSTLLASHHVHKSIDISIPDSSRLDGALNYPVWLYTMQCILERHRLWTYCIQQITRVNISETELDGRFLALQAIAP